METAISILAGVAMSAACGFRVFIPPLVAGIAAMFGYITLPPDFLWLSSPPALIALGAAAAVEVAAYYVPWLDHLLDTITTPAAVVAGTLLTASFITDMSPWLRWTVAVVAGGGVSGAVQVSTVLLRGASTGTTGGFGNFVVSTFEAVSAVGLSVTALAVPLLAIGFLILVLLAAAVFLMRRRAKSSSSQV